MPSTCSWCERLLKLRQMESARICCVSVCDACFPSFLSFVGNSRRCNGTATCFCVSNRNGQMRTHTSSILVCRLPTTARATAPTETTTVVHQLAVEIKLRFLWTLTLFSLPFFFQCQATDSVLSVVFQNICYRSHSVGILFFLLLFSFGCLQRFQRGTKSWKKNRTSWKMNRIYSAVQHRFYTKLMFFFLSISFTVEVNSFPFCFVLTWFFILFRNDTDHFINRPNRNSYEICWKPVVSYRNDCQRMNVCIHFKNAEFIEFISEALCEASFNTQCRLLKR